MSSPLEAFFSEARRRAIDRAGSAAELLLRRLFLITLPIYFAWEMLQMPAFRGVPDSWLAAIGVCALATIGDAVVVLALFALAVLAFRDPRWFAPPRIVPGLGVGVLPLLQPIVLLPMTFWLLARWRTRT